MRCFLCGTLLFSHNASNVKESACKRCFPDYGGGVEDVSLADKPSKPLDKFSTPVHHSKKYIANEIMISIGLVSWYMDDDVVKWKRKFKGVRFY